ncbi:MAG TPA: glycosyltransferase family 2 protein [Acidobacteriaceae bacterium]|nr:glycosyltransferase family 2 protein [Acidobacteriaceae bacterium]
MSVAEHSGPDTLAPASTPGPASQPPLDLSIVMPCLNEQETVATCVRKALDALHAAGLSGEVIVADNGSTDNSVQLATDAGARIVHVAQKGYGSALRAGILAARGAWVLMADSDDSYNFAHLDRFLHQLRVGSDLVMGNRFRGGIIPGAMPHLHRYLGNPVLTAVGRLFFRSPVQDFHCGIRAFRRDSFLRMDLRSTGMEFASEMVVKASLLGMRVSEVPTTLAPDGRSRPPHLRSWRDGWRHLRFLLMYSPRWLFLYPGIALMAVGLAGSIWLLPGPRVIDGIGFDVHTLLYAFMAVLVGFQLLAFAVFTKVFAISEGLLPPDPRLNRIFRYVTLETGLAVGAVLTLAGLAGSIFAVSHWALTSFGALDPDHMLRLVMPSVFALTLGVQIIFSSFFLSILGLRRN